MNQLGHRRRGGRMLVATLGLGLLASVGGVVIHPSPAAAIPEEGWCGNAWYMVQVNHGRVLSPTEPTHIVYNGNPAPIPVTFSSTRSATKSSTISSSSTVSGGFKLWVVNATVSTTLNITTFESWTTSTGISVGPMTLKPGKYQMGDFGVWRQKTSGRYTNEFWCGQTEIVQITAYSVRGQGWKVWQE